MSRWHIVLAGLSALVGFGLIVGELRAQRREIAQLRAAFEKMPAGESARCPPPMMVPSGASISSQMVDAVARQVAQRIEANRPAAPVAVEPALPTAAEEHAVAELRRMVDDVLARGRIGRDETIAMRRQIALSGNSPDIGELRRQLIVAINTNRLIPEDPHSFLP
jgi:hypothetical protein